MKMKYRFLKRSLDLLSAVAAIPIFGPVFFFATLAILIDDRGPVFFVQWRIGRRGVPFRVYKFRTMRGGVVTRVGRALRATGLDELPQYLNIVRGEMSVVGPRPLTQEDVDRLGWTHGAVMARWFVKPGLTGLAQINSGAGAERSRELDIDYIKRKSLKLDAEIIAVSFVMNVVGKRRAKNFLAEKIRRIS
ncbi:MAG: sugar transferase [Bdellovibrionia bacterium]